MFGMKVLAHRYIYLISLVYNSAIKILKENCKIAGSFPNNAK